jgi:biopolymer transport protein ExbB
VGAEEITAGQLLVQGGPMMVPIIFCSILGVGIFIERLITFFNIQSGTGTLRSDIFELLKGSHFKEAVALCDAHPSPVAKILKAGILKFGSSREEIKEAMEAVSFLEIPKLEKRFILLETISHVTPLLGLLGTVTGLATTFRTVQLATLNLNPVTASELSAGIWQAPLATIAGLAVAIPVLVAYNYLVSQVDAIIVAMEQAGAELVNFLFHLSESNPVNPQD